MGEFRLEAGISPGEVLQRFPECEVDRSGLDGSDVGNKTDVKGIRTGRGRGQWQLLRRLGPAGWSDQQEKRNSQDERES